MRQPSLPAVAGIVPIAFAAIVLSAGSASAHAIIELDGVSAVAGKTSPMTLEIQHGCLPSEATVEVEAFVGPAWRGVQPGDVPGWQAAVNRLPRGGWHITWTNLGEPIPFGTSTYFPITVDWPDKPGTYGMRVTQQCTNGTSYDWSQKYRPATANSPSPPLTPRPEVKVVAKAAPRASQAQQSPTPHVDAHAH